MRLPRKFLRFDYGVHILFGILAVFALVLMPLSDGMSIWYFLLLVPLLFVWQLLSALVLALGYQDKMRRYYLLAMVTCVVTFNLFENTLIGEYIVFSSVFFMIWYAYMTYKDATYRTPSFWDLEF